MNKRVVIGGIVAIVLIALFLVIVAVFLLKGKNNSNQHSEETIQAAENLQEYMSGYSKEEIAEILDEELTDEQLNTMDDALISIALPEYGEDITSNSACISII